MTWDIPEVVAEPPLSKMGIRLSHGCFWGIVNIQVDIQFQIQRRDKAISTNIAASCPSARILGVDWMADWGKGGGGGGTNHQKQFASLMLVMLAACRKSLSYTFVTLRRVGGIASLLWSWSLSPVKGSATARGTVRQKPSAHTEGYGVCSTSRAGPG